MDLFTDVIEYDSLTESIVSVERISDPLTNKNNLTSHLDGLLSRKAEHIVHLANLGSDRKKLFRDMGRKEDKKIKKIVLKFHKDLMETFDYFESLAGIGNGIAKGNQKFLKNHKKDFLSATNKELYGYHINVFDGFNLLNNNNKMSKYIVDNKFSMPLKKIFSTFSVDRMVEKEETFSRKDILDVIFDKSLPPEFSHLRHLYEGITLDTPLKLVDINRAKVLQYFEGSHKIYNDGFQKKVDEMRQILDVSFEKMREQEFDLDVVELELEKNSVEVFIASTYLYLNRMVSVAFLISTTEAIIQVSGNGLPYPKYPGGI